MRLIDADALMENAQVYEVECGDEIGDDVREIKAVIVSRIENAPTIYPVRHGRWIDTDFCNTTGEIYECSACHKFYNPEKKAVMQSRQKEKPDFCPSCGARMDGEV